MSPDPPATQDLEMLLEHLAAGVVVHSPTGVVVRVNPAGCRLMGLPARDMLGRGLHDPTWRLLREDGSEMPVTEYPASRVLGAGVPIGNHTVGVRHPDGTVVWVLCNACLEREPSGVVRRAVVMLLDITEQVAAEQARAERESLKREAEAAREAAERAHREKSAFIARMSHELRTPLNAVVGLTSLMLASEDAAAASRERLTIVSDAAEHLLRLIDDLLDLSAAERGKLVVHPVAVDVVPVVDGVIGRIQGMAAQRRVRVDVEHAPAAQHASADPRRLVQVLWHLLSNAVKYNREGGTVSVRIGARGSACVIAVRDSGIGMAPQQVGALFRPFERLGRERSAVSGLGIGLAVTHHLVGLMGGRIEVRSEPGQGSEFVVALPIGASREPPAGEAPAGAARQEDGAARPLRLLYVDDHAVNRLIMRGMAGLEPGWELADAETGEEALEAARRAPPHVILIDLMMPGMDGWSLLEAIRLDPLLRRTPCIAVSANAFAEDIDLARERGFDGYVTKPVIRDQLRGEVRRVVAGARPPG